MNILTQNPAVWKKTIFILTYDENDGYFDHVPPFVAPHPGRPETGKVTKGIDAAVEYVELAQDRKMASARSAREGSIGLGYRVPMIIASPWTRGGCVCSQVFDHTSVLQFLEALLSHKTGKRIEEPNISWWRRAVCGDLTAAFQSPNDDSAGSPPFPPRDAFIEEIHRAQFRALPSGYQVLTPEQIEQVRRDPRASTLLPRQEPGVRKSSALPYELAVDGSLNETRTHFSIRFEAKNELFGKRSAGSPFVVYAITAPGAVSIRNYAVEAGQHLEDAWALADFAAGIYHLRVYGPNGFFREFIGNNEDPPVAVHFDYARTRPDGRNLTGAIEIKATAADRRQGHTLELRDNAYHARPRTRGLTPGGQTTLTVDTRRASGWYDVSLRISSGKRFEKRYAGRVETGKWSISDPAMGNVST